MKVLKKLFPLSFKNIGSGKRLALGIFIYVAIWIVASLILGLVVNGVATMVQIALGVVCWIAEILVVLIGGMVGEGVAALDPSFISVIILLMYVAFLLLYLLYIVLTCAIVVISACVLNALNVVVAVYVIYAIFVQILVFAKVIKEEPEKIEEFPKSADAPTVAETEG